MSWENRIIGAGIENPKDLNKNPKNWRIHTQLQSKSMEAILNKVGWVQEVIVNKRTGNLVDGHLRVELACKRNQTEIPVKYVDLSEEEEDLILLTYDPIGALVQADAKALKDLADFVDREDADICALIENIEGEHGLYKFNPENEWKGMPEFNQEELKHFKLIVHFVDDEAVNMFSELVGQKITEKTKYIWFPKQPNANMAAFEYITVDEEEEEAEEGEDIDETE